MYVRRRKRRHKVTGLRNSYVAFSNAFAHVFARVDVCSFYRLIIEKILCLCVLCVGVEFVSPVGGAPAAMTESRKC